MMLRRSLTKRIVSAVVAVAVFFTISPSLFAVEPHEDPEMAKLVFSGISLFKYYSASLGFVLQKDAAEVAARLEKMPFANIPQGLEVATDDFAASGIGVAYLVVEIFQDLDRLRALREQSRWNEGVKLAAQIYGRISQAYSKLDSLEQDTEITGEEFKVFSVPAGSDLRLSYDEVLEMLDRIRRMLDLDKSLLLSFFLNSGASGNVSAEEAAKLAEQLAAIIEKLKDADVSEELLGILTSGRLLPTAITLKIEPTIAFVGDSISFEGDLTSEGKPLAGRQVDILINSSRYVTARTDAFGHYQGSLAVPYWYVPEIDLQALYYPQGQDVGLYLASLSPVVKLKVLFYEAVLELKLEDKAYPGLETTVAGRFDYGQSPPLNQRKAEIYFDNVFVTEVTAQEAFAQKIMVDPAADVGGHLITVSAAAVGRYAPVIASAVLKVTRATLILDLTLPRVALIPGSVRLSGKLHSEVGTLSGALIKMGLSQSQVGLVSSEGGAFDTKIRVGMGFGLIGSQDLIIQVLPREPWHAPLFTTRAVVMLNVINCGGILALLSFLGIYLPGRVRRRLGVYPGRRTRRAPVAVPPAIAPVYSHTTSVPSSTREGDEAIEEPRSRIFSWYRLLVRLIQGITKILLKPQQTLREFASESSRVLGPMAKYFIEFTRMVERLLYSQYRPTEEDAAKSKQLSDSVEEGLKGEGV